jgi:hypothetical protein
MSRGGLTQQQLDSAIEVKDFSFVNADEYTKVFGQDIQLTFERYMLLTDKEGKQYVFRVTVDTNKGEKNATNN